MFSYSFRELKMGPLLGKRTWGGVIGIDSRYQLVDGTTTTQPQYSIWFHKAGWNVENQGVTPDEEIEDAPHDYLDRYPIKWRRGSHLGMLSNKVWAFSLKLIMVQLVH